MCPEICFHGNSKFLQVDAEINDPRILNLGGVIQTPRHFLLLKDPAIHNLTCTGLRKPSNVGINFSRQPSISGSQLEGAWKVILSKQKKKNRSEEVFLGCLTSLLTTVHISSQIPFLQSNGSFGPNPYVVALMRNSFYSRANESVFKCFQIQSDMLPEASNNTLRMCECEYPVKSTLGRRPA